ncbi:MAG: cyclic nucleotide-binding domain-containing protein [Pyrinomonadaceae bacterium]
MTSVQTESVAPSAAEVQDRVASLRRIKVFADLPEDQLRWFAERTIERKLIAGEVLFRRGDPPRWMAIYIEGEVHAMRDETQFDGAVFIARADDPVTQVSGMLPFSRMTEYPSTGRAVMDTRVLLSR